MSFSDVHSNVGGHQLQLHQGGGLPLSETASKMEHLNVTPNSIPTTEVPDTKASAFTTFETNPLSFSA